MVRAFEPIGQYNITNNSLIAKELSCYAAEFDSISTEINRVIRECLVITAENVGLEFYEKIVGSPRDDLSTGLRREMLVALMNLGVNDYTLSGILRFFQSLNFDCNILERPHIFDLYITPVGGTYTDTQRRYIISRAKDFLPCHLSFTIDFRQIAWSDYDNSNRTFAQIDAMNLSWEQFEQFE